MAGLLFLAFILADGVAVRNPAAWAAPARGAMVGLAAIIGLILAWRSGVRISPGACALIGILAAMTISDVANRDYAGVGLSTWIIYAGVFAAQVHIKRDWSNTLAIAGIGLAVLVGLVGLAGVIPPEGAWNRNVIAGCLLALLPATWIHFKWAGLVGVAAAIVITGCRGAIVGAVIAGSVLARAWELFTITDVPGLVIGGVAMVGGMITWRPDTFWLRWQVMWDALKLWIDSSVLFGLGPGGIIVQSPWSSLPEIHAHNSLAGLLAQVGLVGAGVALATWGLCRSTRFQLWHLATLAGVAIHSLVDDPICWWPVGIVLAIVLGSGVDNAG